MCPVCAELYFQQAGLSRLYRRWRAGVQWSVCCDQCPALARVAVAPTAGALEPREVFLLVNKNVKESRAVAEHYCRVRGVPAANIVTLDLPQGEDIGRKEFEDKVRAPLRAAHSVWLWMRTG